MATVPSVDTMLAGDDIDAAYLAQLKGAVDFFLSPPRCQVYDNSGISCTNNTLTLLTFDTESYDTDSMHSTSSNTGRININTDGTYAIDFYVRFATGTFTELRVNMRKNSGGSSAGGTSIYTHYADTPSDGTIQLHRHIKFPLTSGYYEFFVLQASGSTRTTTAGNLTTGVTFTWLHS